MINFPRAIAALEEAGEFELARKLRHDQLDHDAPSRDALLHLCIQRHFFTCSIRKSAKLAARSMATYYAQGWQKGDHRHAMCPDHLRGTPAQYWHRMFRYVARPLAAKTIENMMSQNRGENRDTGSPSV